MKKIIYILICLLVFGLMSACATDNSTDAAVKETTGSGEASSVSEEEPTQGSAFVEDGLVSVWIANTKEINGRLFKLNYGEDYMVVDEVYRKDGEERCYTYQCNEQGRITNIVGSGDITRNQICAYDDASRLICFEDYDSDGELNEKHVYSYDEQGRLTEHINYWHNNGKIKVDWRRVYRYDEIGNLVELLEYATDDESDLERRCTYTYNAEGQCVSCRQEMKDAQYSTEHVYTYDHRGNLKSEVAKYIANGTVCYNWEWSVIVDENGNTTQVFGGRTSKLLRYTYTEIRVEPELVEKIQRNQENVLATDWAMTSNYEIKKPV